MEIILYMEKFLVVFNFVLVGCAKINSSQINHAIWYTIIIITSIPSVPPEGKGLMYARGSVASRGMRVLSPKIDPPVCEEEGSTA